MSGRIGPHYGHRVPRFSPVPCVVVTHFGRDVKSVYGVTLGHALARAYRWMRKHGDPR